ncbi:MAG: carboxypeptidase regulatory-like domain-containing protein, partial [Bryobacteraceae bacterium]
MRATFAAAILLGAGVCRGQAPASTVVGQVRDASGASVAGAALALKHVDTNETRRAVTGSDGEFTIPDLAPGAYELTAEKEGFERLHQTGLVLAVDQIARLDLALKVGSVTQTVEVTAETPLLNTENASKGDVIVTEEIAEMPLEGRDFQDLAFLVPGVARKPQGGSGSNMAINGARADNTNFTIDGFNDQNPRGGGAQARPPVHTMQEFKMQTSGYSAETGRVAGGVMNMVLKSGGNRVHGDIFEFIRNELFDARNFFAIERPKLRRNQFGATLSGPVWIPRIYNGRNRTFFLFGWES